MQSCGFDRVTQAAEGKILEYKRDLSSPEGVLKTLVAFANSAGGVLAIGIENATGRVRGVSDVLAVEERLANLVSDTIRPRLVPDIEIMPWRKTQVLMVQAYPSAARPHYLERLGPEDGVFIRVGSTNRRADSAQIQEMRRFGGLSSFDEQPIPELDSEALDFRAASELFAQIRKLTPSEFRTLKISTQHQNREVPTIGGYLLFAKNRFDRFPDAWIQAGRFAGKDRSRIADTAEIRTLLPKRPKTPSSSCGSTCRGKLSSAVFAASTAGPFRLWHFAKPSSMLSFTPIMPNAGRLSALPYSTIESRS
jgi:ATP-dependent DNA helicase RecG